MLIAGSFSALPRLDLEKELKSVCHSYCVNYAVYNVCVSQAYGPAFMRFCCAPQSNDCTVGRLVPETVDGNQQSKLHGTGMQSTVACQCIRMVEVKFLHVTVCAPGMLKDAQMPPTL